MLEFADGIPVHAWDDIFLRALGAASTVADHAPAAKPAKFARALGALRDRSTTLVRAREVKPAAVFKEAMAANEQGDRWHELTIDSIVEKLGVSGVSGIDGQQAALRLSCDGPNQLAEAARRGELRILIDQLASTPVAMLGASALLSAATGGIADALAIVSVIVINAGIGYVIESGAERTIAALTHTPQAAVPVLRDGAVRDLPVAEIVRGDVLELRAGVFVAADARVVTSQDLTVDESSLTGESAPVAKHAAPLMERAVPLAERANMVFRGTLVTGGGGRALVVATGVSTQLGRIHALASSVETRLTPLQQQLDKLGRELAIGAGLACVVTMGVGLLRGRPLLEMFRTAVSLGVAAVPEGLPTVSIITLALGLERMRKERVIVRQLSAVETLGSVQVVCLDKTGTLTLNRMSVVAAQLGLEPLAVNSATLAELRAHGDTGRRADFDALLRVAVLCNETVVRSEHGKAVIEGSSTESALIALALDAGCDVRGERARHPLLATQRRAPGRSYMSTRHAAGSGELLAVKGQPNEVLALSSRYLRAGEVRPLGEVERVQIERENERFAARSLRVLGFAYQVCEHSAEPASDALVWVGLVGMEDAPRPGVGDVVARFHAAGIRTIMITGDQSATAQAVGTQIGIAAGEALETVDASRLDRIEASVLEAIARRADIFSRVSPAHKLQIVKALQDSGLIVAMTGDGVNDGPALRAADIGIAMGAGGTDAAREMADVVLEDDELRTLIIAIEQGRAIYDDIRKAVHFILATNLSEILYTFTCIASGLGEPLKPLQLLWINLITDIFPELALAAQPAESDVLARPPRDPARAMFTKADLIHIAGEGMIMTLGALAAYLTTARRAGSGARAGTVGFTTIVLAQLLHAISTRSDTHTVFDRETLAHNPWLPAALGGTALAQLAVSLAPPLQRLLGTVPMTALDWSTVLAGAVGPFLVNELIKQIQRPSAQHDEGRALPALADA